MPQGPKVFNGAPVMPIGVRPIVRARPLVDSNGTDFEAVRGVGVGATPVYQQRPGSGGSAGLPGASPGAATILSGSSAVASTTFRSTNTEAAAIPDSTASPAPAPTSLTPAQQQALDQAIQNAFSDISKGNTAGTIDWKITNQLQGTGLFSQDLIDTITKGEQAAEPHGASFWEKGDQGAKVASWTSNIQESLKSFFTANAQPPPAPKTTGQGGEKKSQVDDTGGQTGTSQTGDGFAQNLGSILGGGGSAGSGSPGTSLDIPSPVVMPGSTQGSGNQLFILAGLGLAGFGAWYYYKHHKKSGPPTPEPPPPHV